MSERAGGFAEPLRVVSDLHLGHPNSLIDSVELLRPLLDGARTVVFNGDTCELGCSEWRPRAEQLLEDLRMLCEDLGVRAVFLTGNHDPDISDQGWLDLADGAVMVTHGDLLLPEVVPWSHQFLLKKKEVRALLRRRAAEEDSLRDRWQTVQMVEKILGADSDCKPGSKGLVQSLADLWPPARVLAILRGWATMFGAAEQFVEHYRPEARILVFGHFHRAGVRRRGSRFYCNTGACMREAKQIVIELDGGELTVRPVRWEEDRLTLGPPEKVCGLV